MPRRPFSWPSAGERVSIALDIDTRFDTDASNAPSVARVAFEVDSVWLALRSLKRSSRDISGQADE